MEVVIARHRDYVKSGYYNPASKTYQTGDRVILETGSLRDYGVILKGNHQPQKKKLGNLSKIIRTLNEFDIKKIQENTDREKKAFNFCKKQITKSKLLMNLISVEYTFDRKKLKFFFTSQKKSRFSKTGQRVS